jgi:hypothetical protein
VTMPHGTPSRYNDSGCRCDPCRDALREKQRANNVARTVKPKDPADPRHGSYTFYRNHGCRCDQCKKAQREQCAIEYQARKAARAA